MQLAAEDIQAFRQEAQTVARLLHPNIVRVLDFGVEGSLPYLVMDYAPNGTLRHLYPKGSQVPLPSIRIRLPHWSGPPMGKLLPLRDDSLTRAQSPRSARAAHVADR